MGKVLPIFIGVILLAFVWFGASWILSYAESTVPYGDLIPSHAHAGGLKIWCAREGASWDAAYLMCTVDGTASVRAGETVEIFQDAGITNNGTIDNDGEILIDPFGKIINNGTIDNDGFIYSNENIYNYATINNRSTIQSWPGSYIWNDYDGTIRNWGNLFLVDTTFNEGTIQNYNTIKNWGSFANLSRATINNFYIIDNLGTFNNAGTINNYCTSVIIGTVTGSGVIYDIDICVYLPMVVFARG